jgi:transcriptional regulator of aromatic amino acid metabolism
MLEQLQPTDPGKGLVGWTLHAASGRRNGPSVEVSYAAIPPGLLESELFGHEKGTFTGPHQRQPGQFAHPNKGTLGPGETRPPVRRPASRRAFLGVRIGSS